MGGDIVELKVPIMHPFHCLGSRVANVIELGRRDDTAKRQLEAAPFVLREYINEMLESDRETDATATIQALFKYLRSDQNGRRAHTIMTNDHAKTLEWFAEDERFEYKRKTNSMNYNSQY